MTRPVLPPKGIVSASVESNLEKLAPHDTELRTLLIDEADEVSRMKAGYTVKRQRLIAITKSIANIVSPVVACRKGCSHCCKMAVAISSHEAEEITKATGRPHVNARMEIDGAVLIEKYRDVPCPFLVNNECSIYEVRPMVCRTYYNLSEFPELCDTLTFPGQDVPGLDLRTITLADTLNSLMDNGTVNDIREYFPPLVAINCKDPA